MNSTGIFRKDGKQYGSWKTYKGLAYSQRPNTGRTWETLGVKKAAVQKYENGSVENLKRATVLKLSEILTYLLLI